MTFAGSAGAAPYVLSNTPGDGTLTVGVDGYGAFGSSVGADSSNAIYDPVGAGIAAGTTFQSGVAIRFGGAGSRLFLTSGSIGGPGGLVNPTVTGTTTTGNSTFTNGGLSFALTQTLTPTFTNGVRTGSTLTQSYAITNTTAGALAFELVRYIDGDLLFDGSLADGGGRLGSGPNQILFEIDSATGASEAATFLGITATNSSSFEIDSFSGLRGRIVAGTALDNIITGDGNGNGFIDPGAGYDVTLALASQFNLGAGQSTTYTTTTFFGTGLPSDLAQTGVVPEPTTLVLFAGVLGLGLAARRSRRAA